MVAICDHLKKLKFSPYQPYAFTEHGAEMLASVLNSEWAIKVNVQIVRIYLKLREILLSNKDVLVEVEKIKNQISDHESKILTILEYLAQKESQQAETETQRRRIGFKTDWKITQLPIE